MTDDLNPVDPVAEPTAEPEMPVEAAPEMPAAEPEMPAEEAPAAPETPAAE